jgi:alpha-glucoside transport system permease protein
VGQHRQIADLHADGDLLRRRLGDLQADLRRPPEDVARSACSTRLAAAFDGGTVGSVSQGPSRDLLLAGLAASADGLFAIYQTLRPVLAGKGMAGALVGSCPARVSSPLRCLDGWLSLGRVVSLFSATLPYGEPQTWLTIPFWNNFFLMVVLIWIQTGFAMVILSAALRGIPEETVEAAVVDGANPFQIFFKIKVPQIMGTIVVVWTTITLVVLKVFDIVFAMTNGQWETQVLANYMYDKLFRANDWGVGSASAMVIMLLVTPILVWNVYNARKEMR